jgi:tryptophan-rich sensory protein
MFQKVNSFKLLASVLLCQLAGAIGLAFTASSLENWFILLEKPTFSPPSWIFFPVWFTLCAYGYLLLHCLGKGTATAGSKNRIAYFWNTVRP